VAAPKPAPVIQVRREMFPLMTRAATTRSATFSDAHTFECVWSSGATVQRVDANGERFAEELLMGQKNVDMSRIANGSAPLLAAYDASGLSLVIGVVEKAWLADGFAHARVRMSKNPANAGIVQDGRDGILHNLSCGYRIDKAERVRRTGDVDLLRATRWTPMEISIVAIPADPSASIKSNTPTFEAMVAA
jgi:Caudovirus prohead serine protease